MSRPAQKQSRKANVSSSSRGAKDDLKKKKKRDDEEVNAKRAPRVEILYDDEEEDEEEQEEEEEEEEDYNGEPVTATSKEQRGVEKAVCGLLKLYREVSSYRATARLERSRHLAYLRHGLTAPLPSGYASLDASRPWLCYWILNALDLLGVTSLPTDLHDW